MTWQSVAIIYPDAELEAAALLREDLAAKDEAGVWVGRKLPGKRPDRAVQVVRDGGTSGTLRDKPRLRFNIWDTTDQKVNDLARLVAALVGAWPGRGDVLKVVPQSGPYEIPDASPRRYLLIEVHFRGAKLS